MYFRSSFECQITEACKIQEERKHLEILNSRAEYNHSAVPKLMTKLGDKEYKKYGEELSQEKFREDMIQEKIQRLRKGKNLERRPVEAKSENKRRKLNSTNYEEMKLQMEDLKRKMEERKEIKMKRRKPNLKRKE